MCFSTRPPPPPPGSAGPGPGAAGGGGGGVGVPRGRRRGAPGPVPRPPAEPLRVRPVRGTHSDPTPRHPRSPGATREHGSTGAGGRFVGFYPLPGSSGDVWPCVFPMAAAGACARPRPHCPDPTFAPPPDHTVPLSPTRMATASPPPPRWRRVDQTNCLYRPAGPAARPGSCLRPTAPPRPGGGGCREVTPTDL